MSRRDELQRSREGYRAEIYRSATGSPEGRRTLLSGALAIVTFLLLATLAARQVTDRAHAIPLVEAGIASTTDIDRLIAEDQPALIQLAQSSSDAAFAIPEYPLRVYVAREELSLPSDQLRAVLLERSATVVYEQGIGAFDRTGQQSFSRFSAQGLLDLLATQMSDDTHERASTAAAVLAVLLALLSGAVLAVHAGWSRMRVLGIAILSGAAPLVLLSGLAWLAAGRIGGDDRYVDDLRTLARAVFEVPFRDAAIVGGGALVLVVIGAAFAYADRRFGAGRREAVFVPAAASAEDDADDV